MKAIEELTGNFGFRQAQAMALILRHWHLSDLFQKNCFTLSPVLSLGKTIEFELFSPLSDHFWRFLENFLPLQSSDETTLAQNSE